MYDDLPKQAKRDSPEGGRELEETLRKAHQLNLQQRLDAEKRERINYYLDNAVRACVGWGVGGWGIKYKHLGKKIASERDRCFL